MKNRKLVLFTAILTGIVFITSLIDIITSNGWDMSIKEWIFFLNWLLMSSVFFYIYFTNSKNS